MANYCFTDLHGNYNLWCQIKNYIDSKDDIERVYCLGDCIDRGQDGYQILKEVLAHRKIIFIAGNHEEFLEQCVPAFMSDKYEDYDLWCVFNGGERTWEAICEDKVSEVCAIIQEIKCAPTHIELKSKDGKDIYLSHSGYNPYVEDETFRLRGKRVKDRYIWNRDHISTPYDEEWFANYTGDFDWKNAYIIHGHTPVQYITGEWRDNYVANPDLYDPRVLHYANGHKIDLDLCTIESNRAVLFNLDTFEEVYFECEEKED